MLCDRVHELIEPRVTYFKRTEQNMTAGLQKIENQANHQRSVDLKPSSSQFPAGFEICTFPLTASTQLENIGITAPPSSLTICCIST
jgi:hypothetical protein